MARALPMPLASLAALLSIASVLPGASPPEEFADRWVESTRAVDRSGIQRLFAPGAKLTVESAGKVRELEPEDYASLLASALKGLRGHHRQRGPVELVEQEGSPPVVSFRVTDRFETPEGYVLEAENQEEFQLEAKDPGEGESSKRVPRAKRYKSRSLTCEALKKPEPWMNYGGPTGVNGYILEAHFYSAPKGMALWIATAVLLIALLLKFVHAMGIKRRF